MTFSIVAFDPETGELGVAVATRALAVGSIVPAARAGVGVIATQAAANTTYRARGLALLALLAQGLSAEETVARLTEQDPEAAWRQVGIVDAHGRTAAFTGERCQPWAGHRLGTHYTCQGNVLADGSTLDGMAETFERTPGALASRLLASLVAGDEAGGDRRGRQSAALLVVREGAYYGIDDVYVDLRVDDHEAPLPELAWLLAVWQREQSGGGR